MLIVRTIIITLLFGLCAFSTRIALVSILRAEVKTHQSHVALKASVEEEETSAAKHAGWAKHVELTDASFSQSVLQCVQSELFAVATDQLFIASRHRLHAAIFLYDSSLLL